MTEAVPAVLQQGVRSRRNARGAVVGNAWRVAATALVLALSAVLFGAAGLLFFFHISVQPVLTGSMRPAFGPGSAIVSRSIPVDRIRPGMVVIFVPPGKSASYAHRVVAVTGSPTHPVLTTKGDANPAADPWRARINAPSIQEVEFGVPWLGNAMVGLHDAGLRALVIVTAGLFIAVAGVKSIVRAPRPRAAAPTRSVSY